MGLFKDVNMVFRKGNYSVNNNETKDILVEFRDKLRVYLRGDIPEEQLKNLQRIYNYGQIPEREIRDAKKAFEYDMQHSIFDYFLSAISLTNPDNIYKWLERFNTVLVKIRLLEDKDLEFFYMLVFRSCYIIGDRLMVDYINRRNIIELIHDENLREEILNVAKGKMFDLDDIMSIKE